MENVIDFCIITRTGGEVNITVYPYGKTGEKHFGVKLTPLEEQIDLEVEMYRAYAYYQESIGEYKPAPPSPHY